MAEKTAEEVKSDLDKKLDKMVRHLKSLDDYNKLSVKGLVKSFFLGLVGAFGATVGLAIIVAILSFITKEFGGLPVVGKLFTDLGYYLRN